MCPSLPAIDNGFVLYDTTPEIFLTYNVGTEATYTCNLGHRLVGQMVLECEITGNWSSAPPTCEGKE